MRFRFEKNEVAKMSDDRLIQLLVIERMEDLDRNRFLYKRLSKLLTYHTMKMKYNAKSCSKRRRGVVRFKEK